MDSVTHVLLDQAPRRSRSSAQMQALNGRVDEVQAAQQVVGSLFVVDAVQAVADRAVRSLCAALDDRYAGILLTFVA